ncbi:MAG: glycoside hydrolase family 15 protein [Bacteroidetes bacterium]|nr:glycoside hydrolase family 15 protein [Bacteroidota bacterium]MBS1632526.1 glycoside hydrolase family 15 protein [Bacteroidota bacterium]
MAHKYNLGIIGNCSYLAYIDTDANVQWMCMPGFDNSFLFGGLIAKEKGGCFRINPSHEYKSSQYYLPNTNILCTEFESGEGRFRVIDLAPRFFQYERYFRPLMLIRKIEWLSGAPHIKVECEPRGDYGTIIPEQYSASNHIRYMNIGGPVRLTTDIPLVYITEKKSFLLNKNYYLVLTYGEPLEAPLADTAERFLSLTQNYWQKWIKSSYLPDIFQEQVVRSALTLKLHQYEDTGGFIAAGTTSLPESPGSGRNWDYRFCWLRDSYYTLQAFNMIGHFDELEKYFEFIQNILSRDSGKIQPLYSITGENNLEEKILPLSGYLNNTPVRIGNAAYHQLQNDVYGQVLLTMLPLIFDKRLIIYDKTQRDYKSIISRLLELIENTLEQPDAGIWEFRNTQQQNCYTLLFHWAGAQAAKKFAATIQENSMIQKADTIIKKAASMLEQCYDPVDKVYTQAIGSTNIDASTLKLLTMQYLHPEDPKAKFHLEAIERKLKSSNGLLYRYRHADDFGNPSSTFLICSFWYAEALTYMGKLDEACQTVETILKYSNHLGLLSEDVSEDGSQWGNFPQTYSHVGMINIAFRISRKLNKPDFML